MNDTMLRQWAMLRSIPRHPRRIDAPTLLSKLLDLGMNVSLRTVQRDLNSLAQMFPLDFDQSKPQGWCWRQGAGQLEIPGMDVHAALTFTLVEQYMQNLLPRTTLINMSPWFQAAEGVANAQASVITQWRDKLRVVPHTLNKIPAPIEPGIQATIYNGLLHERQLEVTYRAITSGQEPKTYPVHPLGLVVMEQAVYLVCTVKDYQDARFLALHRIDQARMLEAASVRPASFDIDAFIFQEFGIRLGSQPIGLVMRLRGVMVKYLSETPVAADQKMRPVDDEWTEVRATVSDTVQLRNWLRSLGPDAVVVEPEGLRQALYQEWSELAQLYGAE
jgi:predicted DNA-binding transcriptional regulator YafY